MAERIYIVAAKRTAIGSFGGSLRDFVPNDLLAQLTQKMLAESHIAPEDIQQYYAGCCVQANAQEGIAPIIARQALLKAGLSDTIHSYTIDRACTSAMYAIKMAMDAMKLGEAELTMAGGVDVMSRTPYVDRSSRFGSRIGKVELVDPLFPIGYKDYNPVAVDAGEVALEYGITREMQDDWAFGTQARYQEAKKAGKWPAEILPVEIAQKKGPALIFDEDEFPKPNLVREKMSGLPTVFNSPTVTAGNAPGINDGAAMVVLAAESAVKSRKLSPMAEIVDYVTVNSGPRYINTVPGLAIVELLRRNSLTVDDLECIEINEAFAAVPLTSSVILGDKDPAKIEAVRRKINVNGGSIAMGHPVGATGCRIVVTALHELSRRGGGYAVAAICGGLAQGDALLLKV